MTSKIENVQQIMFMLKKEYGRAIVSSFIPVKPLSADKLEGFINPNLQFIVENGTFLVNCNLTNQKE